MPFLGNLEDISIVDVLQLLCLARKSGLLTVDGPTGPASIVLREGAITGAQHPSPDVHVGAILVDLGLLSPSELADAMSGCASSGTPIVTTLVRVGRITQQQGWTALSQLVERTVAVMVEWQKGRFAFDQHDDDVSDDFRYLPAVVEEAVGGVDTQQVLVEVLRVFDERNRTANALDTVLAAGEPPEATAASDAESPHRTDTAVPQPLGLCDTTDRVLASPDHWVSHCHDSAEARTGAPSDGPPSPMPPAAEDDRDAGPPVDPGPHELGPDAAPPTEGRQFIVYSEDGFLRNLLRPICEQYRIVVHAPAGEHHLMTRIQRCLVETHVPPLVIDISNPQEPTSPSTNQLRLAQRIKRRFPMLPLVVLGPDSRDAYLRAFELGARSYLPATTRAASEQAATLTRSLIRLIVGCVQGYFDERDALCEDLGAARREMTLLRHRVLQMTQQGASVDISLILLQHVAEYFERCVLFVARRTDLLGLGAFGLGHNSETTTTVMAGLKIPLDVPSVPRTVLEDHVVYRGRIDDEVLQTHLLAKIGPSLSREGLLLPLVGPERSIALIYADHGSKEPRPFATDALEVLASVAGLALQRKTRTSTAPH